MLNKYHYDLLIFQRNILSPYSDSFTLKIVAECFSSTSVSFYQIAWCHIPDDDKLQVIYYFYLIFVLSMLVKPKFFKDIIMN